MKNAAAVEASLTGLFVLILGGLLTGMMLTPGFLIFWGTKHKYTPSIFAYVDTQVIVRQA